MSKFSVKVSLSIVISLEPFIRKHSYLDHGHIIGCASACHNVGPQDHNKGQNLGYY